MRRMIVPPAAVPLAVLVIAGCLPQTDQELLLEGPPDRSELLADRQPEAPFPALPSGRDFAAVMNALSEARAEAHAELHQKAERLYINKDVQVGEFARRCEHLRDEFQRFVRSTRTVAYEFADDGTVTVELEMPLVLLVDKLHAMCRGFYAGTGVTEEDVESMLDHYPGQRFITAKGTAKIAEEAPETQPAEQPTD